MQSGGGENIASAKQQLLFERHNSKYNRCWEQITTLSLFFIATFLAWIGLRYSIINDLLQEKTTINIIKIVSNYNSITLTYLLALLILALAIGYLASHLFRSRDKIKELFDKLGLNYD